MSFRIAHVDPFVGAAERLGDHPRDDLSIARGASLCRARDEERGLLEVAVGAAGSST